MIRTSTFFSVLFAVAANFSTIAKAQAVNVNDSLTLVALYDSTNGPGWATNFNWLAGPVSTWSGITVTGDRVTKIDLPFNNLSGALPASIVNLNNLQYFDISFNELAGAIPADIGKLTNLTYLNLSVNYFSGAIPASITNLANLQGLYLDFNELSANIPADIGNLSSLTILQLESNQLSGSIPVSVNKLTNLTGLFLNINQLSGALPRLEKNSSLINLYLDHNQLTGNILDYFHYHNRLLTVNLSHNLLSQSTNDDFPLAHPKQNGYGDISFNQNTFNGLEFIAKKMPQVIYSPQALIHVHRQGNTLSVNAGGTLSNNTYKWIKAGKAGTMVITGDSTFAPTESGNYFVQVKNSIATKLTLLSDTINFTVSGLIAANSKVTNVNNYAAKQGLQVYPNPASSIVHIQTGGKAAIVLTNTSGEAILAKTITGNAVINVSALANGVYYIKNKATGEALKIIVQH